MVFLYTFFFPLLMYILLYYYYLGSDLPSLPGTASTSAVLISWLFLQQSAWLQNNHLAFSVRQLMAQRENLGYPLS
jgi:hypothetical protein